MLVVTAGCAGLSADVGSTASPDGAGIGDRTTESLNATVVRVVDGDTVDVRYPDGSTDTVRLLGVDTPEVHVENTPPEFEGVPDTDAGRACLHTAGEEASTALRERVAGHRVKLVVDETADRRDRYDRLLAYLERDGTDLNRWLVAGGHARVYDSTFVRSEEYYRAESDAQDRGVGVWECRNRSTAVSAVDASFVRSES